MSYGDNTRSGGYGGDGQYGGQYGAQSGGYSGGGERGQANDYYGSSSTNQTSGGYDNRQQYGTDGSRGGYGGDTGASGGMSGGAGSYGGRYGGDYDQDEVINQARQDADDQDGNIFSSAMNFLGQEKKDDEDDSDDDDVDEEKMRGAHQQLYGDRGIGGPQDSRSLGAGAAVEALKMFGGGGGGRGGHSGKKGQSQFIGMAMAQAGKLFDQQQGKGNVAHKADKQSTVNTAAKMALKMYMKNEGKGGSSGGGGGLMGLANKFM